MSSGFKKYSQDIPRFLHDRPRFLVTHCLGRLTSSEDILFSNIDVKDGNKGVFSEISANSANEIYEVRFGDAQDMPRCSCNDWRGTFLPCKHFFAVMKKYRNWSWDNFPSQYKDSVFLILDSEVIQGTVRYSSSNPETQDTSDLYEEEPLEEEKSKKIEVKAIPKRVYPKRSAASSCRDLLQQIKSITYIVHDEDSLDNLYLDLQSALEKIRHQAPKEEGLILEKKRKETSSSFGTAEAIPNRGRRKRPWSGRVGASAAAKRAVCDIKVDLKDDYTSADVIEEHDIFVTHPDCYVIENEDDAKPVQDSDLQPMQDNDAQPIQDNDAQPMQDNDLQSMQD